MKLDKILIARQEAILPEHVEHGDIIYDKRLVLSRTDNQCTVAFMEIPPGKSAYPRHYHFDITEVFYEESQNTPELRGVSALKHFAKTEAVGRAYLPDMRPPKIRLRLKRPSMSSKHAPPTHIVCLRQVSAT
jgi:hypothetical protein